ncbi:lambda-crystallin homolog isoform X2 [Aplysia californica]|uniref:Lambda-crystallin homolog isoform X2 n=1 Tax=Aplysia californica TaxID=6500 RepID=A0ABM0K678_APLCA|nr:lambda-crystallin homolog isoform X2 [Aplysia californica]
MASKKIAVIGSGLIGRSFSMLFVSGGYQVSVYDVEPAQNAVAKDDIWSQLNKLEEQGLLRGSLSKEQQFANITYTEDLAECVNGAFFIQECIPERLELKKSVFAKIEKVMSPDAIMSSSTSALMPSLISGDLTHKNRFVVTHPTNPPFYAPATEVVPASWTDADVIEKTVALLKEIGQAPVLLKKEINGFVLNRIQYAILAETWNLIRDGIVSPEDCDVIMSQGLGMRYAFMGPWETAYLNADGLHSYSDRYADMIYGIQKDFLPPEKIGGETLDVIQRGMENVAGPVENLEQRRQWRDRRLVALAKLKAGMNKEEAK